MDGMDLDRNPEPRPLADWLRDAMARANGGDAEPMTQQELSWRLQTSLGAVNRWLRGAAYPSYPQLVKLYELFGSTPLSDGTPARR